MVVTLSLVAAVVLAWSVACGRSGTAGRTRSRDRRLRYVARHPEHANAGDVRRLLARELDGADADLVVAGARRLGIPPWTMLTWVRRFDVASLAVVVAADVSHEELLRHLAVGTRPDLAQLGVLAGLNGLPSAQVHPVAAVPAGPSAPAAHCSRRLPPIFEPGSWPYGPTGTGGTSGPGSLAA